MTPVRRGIPGGSRNGDFDALLAVLNPDVVLRADTSAVRTGATAKVRGARAVAETLGGRARAAQLAVLKRERLAEAWRK